MTGQWKRLTPSCSAAAIQQAGRFFIKEDPVHQTLRAISEQLTRLGIPHCIAGGMALVAHGYDRTTLGVDVLVTAGGLAAAQECLEGLGYVRPFAGSRNLRDSATNVRIEFLVAGQYPGDGKPKPVAFPDPANVAVEIDGIRYVQLPTLVELKLASGMTAAHRLRDLADVQELIRVLRLPRDFVDRLNAYVRERYLDLWQAVRSAPSEE